MSAAPENVPKVVRTLARVTGTDADGNFLVEWDLACPVCGSAAVGALQYHDALALLRCENGHLSALELVEASNERLVVGVQGEAA